MIMLDTNICSYILRNRPPGLRDKLKASVTPAISCVVYAELCYGVELGASHLQKERYQQLRQFTDLLKIIDWSGTAAEHYANIRVALKRQGTPIGNMDLLIAAHARSLDCVLVTNNIGEFKRVDNLKVENWV
uniref:Ribonuclease VapC n=1 Tax=Candidatus Kentrum sp. MB TaxID=2138164 RepID=A0A450X9K1_9GAMM|nr:MAG: tRNA(fMet)-specific endonuclease VapC [Candidatus Kentron sp. MB]VFK33799.1 MAG: tRNA(fMet)-specific endonuclease VapC [Candidatus Kentron sp. MB]VFK76389.1 MAG: tRNA(fMet)-specific endonuclease VapC [Candidatus Kentron sp. MB]